MSWVSPTGHNDPDNAWTAETLAYDGDTGTSAYDYTDKYTPFLELLYSGGLLCDKIRFWAKVLYSGGGNVDVDVFYDDAWQHLYYGSFDELTWVQKSLSEPKLVTKARIRFYKYQSCTRRLYEFEFHKAEPSAPGYSKSIGLWQMNDNAANTLVKDNSEMGDNDGTAQANTDQLATGGKINGALSFNGTSDFVSVSDDICWDMYDLVTIFMWFKTSVADQGRLGFVIHDKSNYKYELGGGPELNSLGEIGFRIKTASGTSVVCHEAGQDYYADGNWHFLVATYDKNLDTARLKLYIDGICEATADGYAEYILEGDEGILIGEGTFDRFQGDIDCVGIINRVLSDEEIAWLWNEGNGREHLSGSRPLVGSSLASGERRLAG